MNLVRRSGLGIHKKTTSEIICQNVGVQSQTIFQDYRCTLKTTISYFGRMYIGEEHVIFVSSMFGIIKKVAIPIDSITELRQPQIKSITIQGKNQGKSIDEQYVFTGLTDGHAFKIIHALWKRQKLSAEMMRNNQEEKESEGSKHGFDDSEMEANIFKETGQNKQSIKMLQVVFPCSVQQFYDYFFADDADLYSRKMHLESKKGHHIVTTPWKKDEELQAEVREITGIIKVKGVPLMSEAHLNQVWMMTKKEKQDIHLKVVTNVHDVPYGTYFNCEEHLTISKEAENKCRYVVNTAVIFNKHSSMMGIIISKTFSDFNQDYQIWTNNVKEVLQKKRKSIEEAHKLERKKLAKSMPNNVQFQNLKESFAEKDEERGIRRNIDGQFMKQMEEVRKQVVGLRQRVDILIILCIGLILIIGLSHIFEWIKPYVFKSEL